MFIVGRLCDHEDAGFPDLLPLTGRASKVLEKIGRDDVLKIAEEAYRGLCEKRGLGCLIVKHSEYTSNSGCHEVVFTFPPTASIGRHDVYVFEEIGWLNFRQRRFPSINKIIEAAQRKYLDEIIDFLKRGKRVEYVAWKVAKGFCTIAVASPIYDYMPILSVKSPLFVAYLI